jgi:hypothetical protein
MKELKEIHSPDVTSDLARELQKADHDQGESGTAHLPRTIA